MAPYNFNWPTGRPRKKIPGRIALFFFWATRPGYYVPHVFFLKILGSIFMQLRPGHLPRFFEDKWGNGSKVEILRQFLGLNCV